MRQSGATRAARPAAGGGSRCRHPPRVCRTSPGSKRSPCRTTARRHLSLPGLTGFTVRLGPIGSGKSTRFDVCAFLAECFSVGLRRVWDRRNRLRALRSRGCNGPIQIEIKDREGPGQALITCRVAINEEPSGPVARAAR